MKSLELSNQLTETSAYADGSPYLIGFVGGGSTGNTLAGFLDAVEAGLVDGVNHAEGFAVVTTGDNGSATGRLRKITGTAATGDLRRTHSALSANRDAASDFESRFDEDATPETVAAHARQLEAQVSYGNTSRLPAERVSEIMDQTIILAEHIYYSDPEGLKGYALGHLVLTAIAMETGIVPDQKNYSYSDTRKGLDVASYETGELLAGRATVIPVSAQWHNLKMRDGNEILYGEHVIDDHEIKNPDDVEVALYTEPDGSSIGVPLNPHAKNLIERADNLVWGPGSVYTSIIPSALTDDMPEAVTNMKRNGGTLTLVGNLDTQNTETKGWSADQYVTETEKYIGSKFDVVVFNDDTEGIENAVVFDRDKLDEAGDYHVVATKISKGGEIVRDPSDPLRFKRSKVAHDMSVVARVLGPRRDSRELVNA